MLHRTSEHRYAYETQELGHGALTYALLGGLGEKEEPKAASEGIVWVHSLIQYVSAQVRELTKGQQSVVTSDFGKDFPLSARSH
jgi:uncharacterized caspase-like protein